MQNSVELYIELNKSWELLDFNDSLTIKKTFLNLSNPYTSGLGYSFSSTLPLTKRNSQLLGYDIQLNQRYDVRVHVNNVRISEGYIEIKKKKKDSLTFNYVEAGSDLIALLDRDYEVEVEIDTEALLGPYLDPETTGLNHVEWPHIVDEINTQTPYRIGIADDGKRNLLYEFLEPAEDKSVYETYLTGAHPRIFRTRDFYISHKLESLISKVLDRVNVVNNKSIRVNSNSQLIKDYLADTHIILKKGEDQRITPRLSGQETSPYLYLNLDFAGSINTTSFKNINPYNLFAVKVAKNQTQQLDFNLPEVGSGNFAFATYTHVDSVATRNLRIAGELTNTAGDYVKLFVRHYTNSSKEILLSERVIISQLSSGGATPITPFTLESFPEYYLEIEAQVKGNGVVELEVRDNDVTVYDYVLSDTFTFNPLKIIKDIAEQTNARVAYLDGVLFFIDKTYTRFDTPFDTYDFDESEDTLSGFSFYGIKTLPDLVSPVIDTEEGLTFADSSYLPLTSTQVEFTSITDSDNLSGDLNYKPGYIYNIPEEYTLNLDSTITNTVSELLSIKNKDNPDNVTLDVSSYVSEEDYIRLNVGEKVLQNGKYLGLSDIDGVYLAEPLQGRRTYMTLNSQYEDLGAQGTYALFGDFGTRRMTQSFNVSTYPLSDFVNTRFEVRAKVYSRGIEYAATVALTGTPPANLLALINLIEDAYDAAIAIAGIPLSTAVSTDNILFSSLDAQSTFYITLDIFDKDLEIFLDTSAFASYSVGRHLTNIGALRNKVGVIKGMDYPAYPYSYIKTQILFYEYNNPNIKAFYYVNQYIDTNDVTNGRNKLPSDYLFFQMRPDLTDTLTTPYPLFKRTVDSEPKGTLTNTFIISDGEYINYQTSVFDKPAWAQFKWLPQLDVDVNDVRVLIDDNIYCIPDTSNQTSSADSPKVFINFMTQYNYYAPALFRSAHETPIQNELNAKLFNEMYGKGLDTFNVRMRVYDYVNIIRVNPIVQIAGEDYYLIDMEYNLVTENAKIRGIKKTTV